MLSLLILAGTPCLCGSVLLHSRLQSASSPFPSGRHIQYVNRGRYGMRDRLSLFSWLMQLADQHKATVHLLGGEHGARNYLGTKHSALIHEDWSHYINTTGTCGQSPFNEVVMSGCKIILDTNLDFNTLFDDGSNCVSLRHDRFSYKNHRSVGIRGAPKCVFQPAASVVVAADQFLVRYKVPHMYGAYHIRRCDRLAEDIRQCSSVDSVLANIQRASWVDTWVIFMYAELRYITQLRNALAPLKETRRFIIEGDPDFQLSPVQDGDNYFSFLIMEEIRSRATISLDTWWCQNTTEVALDDTAAAGNREANMTNVFARDREAQMWDESRDREAQMWDESRVCGER